MVKQWISLNPFQLQVDTFRKNPDQSNLPSPYDIPEALRIIRDEENTTLEVDFSYIGEDEEKVLDYDRCGVKIEVGKHSRRIRSIQVESQAKRDPGLHVTEAELLDHVDELMAAVDSFIEGLLGEADTEKRTIDNYRIAKEALRNNREQIATHAT